VELVFSDSGTGVGFNTVRDAFENGTRGCSTSVLHMELS